jgi:hypothetical protein
MARQALPILLPVIQTIDTPTGTYQLLAGRHDTRGEWDTLATDRYDVLLDGLRLASIFNGPSYPGRLSVSVNGIRWLGPLPKDHFDHRYHDCIGTARLDETFELTVQRCEAIHHNRGGWGGARNS